MMQGIVLSKFDDFFEIFAASYIEKCTAPLLVVDDGLSNEVKAKYDFEYVESPKPFSFAKSVNLALESTNHDVVVYNDDLVIETDDFDVKLDRIAHSDKSIGLVGPIITNVMNHDQLPANKVDEVEYTFTDFAISFACVYIKRDVIRRVGVLDRTFYQGTGSEDNDFCCRVVSAGYQMVIAQQCFIEHGGEKFGELMSNTLKRTGEQYSEANREYLFRKWNFEFETITTTSNNGMQPTS
jgi:GT2 family glycosyltransferase